MSQKIHNCRLLFTVGAELLRAILHEAHSAEQILFRYFKRHHQFGSHERRILTDSVYGCLRQLRSLKYSLTQQDENDWQLSIEQARHVIALWLLNTENCSQAAINNTLNTPLIIEKNILSEAIVSNLPDWLYNSLVSELGVTATQTLAQALMQQAPLDLRVNTLLVNRKQVLHQLHEQGLEAIPTPFSVVGLRLPARTLLANTQIYQQGLIEIQDEASQLIAPLLAVRRHQIVVDLCAGAGGKTLHIGALMANTGTIHAFDADARRLDQLCERVKRAGLNSVRSARIDNLLAPPILALRGKVDRVLVDAPCTGSGTVRRNPEIKWRHHNLEQLGSLQRKLLNTAADLLRLKGRLVYATCSLLAAENDQVVKDFLAVHSNFAVIPPPQLEKYSDLPLPFSAQLPALRLYPHLHGTDGFYAVIMEKLT